MLAALLTNLESTGPVIPVIPIAVGNPGGPSDDDYWRPKRRAAPRDEIEDIVAVVITLAEASGP